RTPASSSSPRIGRAIGIGIIEARKQPRSMKVRWSLAPPRTTCTRLRLQLEESLAVMGAAHVAVERSTTLANPPDASPRNSRDQAMRRDVLGVNIAGGNHRIPCDTYVAINRSVCVIRRTDNNFS